MPVTNIEGAEAHGADVSNTSPVLMGGKDDSDLLKGVKTDAQGRLVTVSNQEAAPASATQGPATTTLTGGGNTTLVAAPGSGFAIVVVTVQMSVENTGSTIEVVFKEDTGGTPRLRFTVKDNGIYPPFTMSPGWKLAENTPLVAQRVTGGVDVVINYHYYVEEI